MNDTKNAGWVKLWRDQFNHEISERRPWCDGYAWSYLYSRANYRPAIVNFRNQYISVERGQFVTSKSKLLRTFGWSKKRTNSFLTSLEVGGMCSIRTTNRFIIITISHYDKFQSTEDEKGTTEGAIEGATESPQRATDKKNKEVKNNICRENALQILAYLNEKTGKRYRDASLIEARLKEGGTVDDCRRIIDTKLQDPYFKENPKYLSPQTLFRKSHWDQYLNEAFPVVVPSNSNKTPLICPRCRRELVAKSYLLGDGCTKCQQEMEARA